MFLGIDVDIGQLHVSLANDLQSGVVAGPLDGILQQDLRTADPFG